MFIRLEVENKDSLTINMSNIIYWSIEGNTVSFIPVDGDIIEVEYSNETEIKKFEYNLISSIINKLSYVSINKEGLLG